jgi:hypothetical protein
MSKIQFGFGAKKKTGLGGSKPTALAAKPILPTRGKAFGVDEDEAKQDEPRRDRILTVENQRVIGEQEQREEEQKEKPLVIPLPSSAPLTAPSAPPETPSVSTDSKTSAPTYSAQKFGLTIMHRAKPLEPTPDTESTSDIPVESNTKVPLLLKAQHQRSQLTGIDVKMSDEEKFKRDIEHRPAEADLDAYERIPVEDFGAALLRGMGWKDGEPLGKNGPDAPVVPAKRDNLLGLGAKPSELPQLTHKKHRRK